MLNRLLLLFAFSSLVLFVCVCPQCANSNRVSSTINSEKKKKKMRKKKWKNFAHARPNRVDNIISSLGILNAVFVFQLTFDLSRTRSSSLTFGIHKLYEKLFRHAALVNRLQDVYSGSRIECWMRISFDSDRRQRRWNETTPTTGRHLCDDLHSFVKRSFRSIGFKGLKTKGLSFVCSLVLSTERSIGLSKHWLTFRQNTMKWQHQTQTHTHTYEAKETVNPLMEHYECRLCNRTK